MEDKKDRNLGFLEVLGLIFIVLKLCKVINWPWIWVLAPIWISIIIVIALVIAFVIVKRKADK